MVRPSNVDRDGEAQSKRAIWEKDLKQSGNNLPEMKGKGKMAEADG